jgi:hypothetical protein
LQKSRDALKKRHARAFGKKLKAAARIKNGAARIY